MRLNELLTTTEESLPVLQFIVILQPSEWQWQLLCLIDIYELLSINTPVFQTDVWDLNLNCFIYVYCSRGNTFMMVFVVSNRMQH